VRLYHFTAEHLASRVKAEGIILGKVPSYSARTGSVVLHRGFQWLTHEPRFDRQTWATRVFAAHDRAAVRFEVDIPTRKHARLQRWVDVADEMAGDLARDLASVGGADAWWLYQGVIPRTWLSLETHRLLEVAA